MTNSKVSRSYKSLIKVLWPLGEYGSRVYYFTSKEDAEGFKRYWNL